MINFFLLLLFFFLVGLVWGILLMALDSKPKRKPKEVEFHYGGVVMTGKVIEEFFLSYAIKLDRTGEIVIVSKEDLS